jgi:sugar-specific transcriptional regulator TrmB
MLKDNQTEIAEALQALNLSPEVAEIYLYLARNGHSSALSVSSKTGISRTQVYRHLEQLIKLSLVSEEKPYWGTYFYALPISNLETEINLQQQNLQEAKTKLKAAENVFENLFRDSDPSQTITYKGISGLKQALWHLTKAKKEYKVFEVDHISNLLDLKFSRSMRQKEIDKGIRSYDLSNKKSHRVADLEPVDLSLSKIKYIPPEILKIKYEIIIYNDQITLIDYFSPEPTALEIKNKSLSLMMSQMHDAFWAMAEEVEWVD